jgi:hypothetical protein
MAPRRPLLSSALCLLALACGGCGGDLRADELGRSVDALASAAGEGGLLAQGIVEDRTKTTFVRVRARELAETVQHEAEKLQDATATGPVVPTAKQHAVELAGELSQALGDLQTAPADSRSAAQAERTLDALARRASRLAKALT